MQGREEDGLSEDMELEKIVNPYILFAQTLYKGLENIYFAHCSDDGQTG